MQTGSQGRSYYTLEEVKQMAADKGLPCEVKTVGGYRLRGKRVGMEIVTPQSTLEALGLNREWSAYYPHDYSAQTRKGAVMATV